MKTRKLSQSELILIGIILFIQPTIYIHQPVTSFRDLDQLRVPRVRTALGSRAFSVAAHRLWNEGRHNLNHYVSNSLTFEILHIIYRNFRNSAKISDEKSRF